MTKVTIANVTKQFPGGFKGVDDVSVDIAEGSFVTLLGPSGSGKTTTLRMVAGLETPTSGTIAIGEDVVFGSGRTVPTYRRNIGMVFQSYAVWPHMTVADNIGFPLTTKRTMDKAAQRKAVLEMIDLVNLTGLDQRLPSELSGGQQQRVALARALVAQPAVLLFDEPLSNLDAKLRESMRVLIKELHHRLRITAIYVTHDQLEAMWLSDVIHVMSRGKVVQSGTPRQIYEEPSSLFVAEFVGQANVFPVTAWDAGSRMARTEFANLRVAGNASLTPSHVLVRFNKVHLRRRGPADAVGDNGICAEVAAIQFIGDRYHVELVTKQGTRIVAHLDDLGEVTATGESVVIVLPPEHVRPVVE